MDPLTNQQVNTLGAQGYKEGDNVPGKGTLLPDGTYSQPAATGTAPTTNTSTPVAFTAPAVKNTYVDKSPVAQYDASGQFTGYKNYDGSFTNPDGSLKGDTSKVPAGWDAQTYANFKAANPNLEPDAEDTAMMNAATLSPQEQARQDNLDAMATAQKQFSGAISGWRLSTDEQAQVDDLKQQYDQMIADQKLTNTSASGTANIRGYQTGAAEYDPTFQAKTIGSIVTAGANKIKGLQVEEAGKVAQLTRAFKDDDIKNIKIAYDSLKDVQDKKSTEIQKTIDEANTKIKDAQTAQQNAKDFQLKLDQFDLQKSTSALDAKYKTAEIAKLYNDMKTSDITGARDWVTNIKNGTAKLSDVPANMKNAVAAGLANSGSTQTDMLQTTKSSLDTLKTMIDNNQGFSSAVGVKGLSSFFGIKGTPIAGSSAADFDAKLKQTVNDVVLPNLTILHGLGRVTDREFQALQSSITSLNTNLSEGEFKREFNSLYQTISDKITQDTTHNGIKLPQSPTAQSSSAYNGITLPN